jgi:hypothetical protein
LVSAIRLAQDHFNPTQNVIILSTNPAAIQAITNLWPYAGQFHPRESCTTLTYILSFKANESRYILI